MPVVGWRRYMTSLHDSWNMTAVKSRGRVSPPKVSYDARSLMGQRRENEDAFTGTRFLNTLQLTLIKFLIWNQSRLIISGAWVGFFPGTLASSHNPNTCIEVNLRVWLAPWEQMASPVMDSGLSRVYSLPSSFMSWRRAPVSNILWRWWVQEGVRWRMDSLCLELLVWGLKILSRPTWIKSLNQNDWRKELVSAGACDYLL